MSIKVDYYSIIGTYDLLVRGTLPNGQTAHELFTVEISEIPPILIDQEVASKYAALLTNAGPPIFVEDLPLSLEFEVD